MKSYTTQAQPHNPRRNVTLYVDAETEQIVGALALAQRISFSGAIRRIVREWNSQQATVTDNVRQPE